MRLVRVRVLRPFEHRGRLIGTGERLLLLTHDADVLRESGHVAVIVNGEQPTQPGRWAEPTTR